MNKRPRPIGETDRNVWKILSVPDLLTLLNAACGFFCIALCLSGRYIPALSLLVLAVLFDGLDGLVARKTGRGSRLGPHLDNLADFLSFVAAPACFLLIFDRGLFFLAGGLALVLSGILRLSHFMILPFSGYFRGMPTTLNGFIFPAVYGIYSLGLDGMAGAKHIFPAIAIACAVLMISPFKIRKLF